MEINESFSAHYLKRIGEPQPEGKYFKLQSVEVEEELIPMSMKTSFYEFLESINNRIPFEEELKEWHLTQILKETI